MESEIFESKFIPIYKSTLEKGEKYEQIKL